MTITIPIPLKCPSLNELYAGRHWSYRKKLKDEWHMATMIVVREMKLAPFEQFPLTITSTAYFSTNRRRDTDNTIVGCKLFFDALTKMAFIPDDSPKYISEIILKSPVLASEGKVVFLIES